MMACTVASLVPFPIHEPIKPLFPGDFPIGASDGKKPVLLVIKGAVRAQYNEDYKIIDMPVPAETVAASVVNDYVNGQMYTDTDAKPALFFVEGEWSQADFEKNFAKQIEQAVEQQDRWFRKLVSLADDIWQQHHQHKFIMDLQRWAARHLNYKREWLDDATDKIIKCPACMQLISRDAAICFACKCIVNPQKAAGFQFAGQTPQPVK